MKIIEKSPNEPDAILLINEQAVSFYKKRGYKKISNYGKYVNNPKAICFEKKLI